MRRLRPLFCRSSTVFCKKHVPSEARKELFGPPEKRTGDTLFANAGLLELLKEREFVNTKQYDFEPLDFLLGTKQAYEAVAQGFASAPECDWDQLEAMLPAEMLAGVKSYVSKNDDGNACLPNVNDKFIPKIASVNWTIDPPESFPFMHPFGSLPGLVLNTLFNPKGAKKKWTEYLEECGEWYRKNKLKVDVLYLVLRDKKGEADDQDEDEWKSPKDLEIVSTHLWTFCRELDGEWKIIAMDH